MMLLSLLAITVVALPIDEMELTGRFAPSSRISQNLMVLKSFPFAKVVVPKLITPDSIAI